MGNRGGLNLYQLQPGFIIQQFMPEGYRARAKMHAEKKMFKGVRKIWNASRICVSSLRRGHANLLCIVPILIYVLPEQARKDGARAQSYNRFTLDANKTCGCLRDPDTHLTLSSFS